VYLPVYIVGNRYVVDEVVPVEIKVVDPGVPVIEVPFELLKGLRLLEEIHHGIEVHVVTRETQVLLRPVLSADYRPCCYQDCEDRCEN
jgi:hypothetical protein